jgi:hypothetical protein
MWDVFLLTIFPPVSHQILDIGDMSRGDSSPSSSIAPASSTPPSISFHMSRNPENHVILRPNGLTRLGKKCHIDGADHAITLITVKSSILLPSARSALNPPIPFAFQQGQRHHIARSAFSRPNWTIIRPSQDSKLQPFVMFRTPQFIRNHQITN